MEITPFVWGLLLVLCWHAYAMGFAAFQQNQPRQKAFLAFYLVLAIYISWYVRPFEYLFSMALAVNAVFGVFIGLIMHKLQKRPYVVHITALIFAFITLCALYYWRYHSQKCDENLISDGDLLEALLEPASIAAITVILVTYSAAHLVIKKYIYLVGNRTISFGFIVCALFVALPFSTAYFHVNSATVNTLAVIALIIMTFAICLITASIERWFATKETWIRGIGISIILFLANLFFWRVIMFS